MITNSYGVLLYREGKRKRHNKRHLEVFLIKPNGPIFWDRPHLSRMWGIPKGKIEAGENFIQAAKREFEEETGVPAPESIDYFPLAPARSHAGKVIQIYTANASGLDVAWRGSNTQTVEYPKGSGQEVTYAETSAGAWFGLDEARELIGAGQLSILNDFVKWVKSK